VTLSIETTKAKIGDRPTAAVPTEHFTREDIEFNDRDREIAFILTACFYEDSEVQRLHKFTDANLGHDDKGGRFGRNIVVARPLFLCDAVDDWLAITGQLATRLIRPVTRLVDQARDIDQAWSFSDWPDAKQAKRIRLLFHEAGIDDRLAAEDDTEDDLISIDERQDIAAALRAARQALRDFDSPPGEAQIEIVEADLRNARSLAEAIPAYCVRLDAAIQCMKDLRHAHVSGDRLTLVGEAHSAIATVLDNLEV
jgi:hypothetical protein